MPLTLVSSLKTPASNDSVLLSALTPNYSRTISLAESYIDGQDRRGKGKWLSDSQSSERPCEKLRKIEVPFASVTRFLFYLLNRV